MKRLSLLSLLLLCGIACAQNAVNLSVTPINGTSPVTATVTWSTTPAATSCTPSGGWSGPKAVSGTQVVTGLLVPTDFALSCTWAAGAGQTDITWTIPSQNTDGTPLTNLDSFKVVYGTSSTALTNVLVTGPTAAQATVKGLAPGPWFFAVQAINSTGAVSANSNVVTANVVGTPGASLSKSVHVEVTKQPNPPSNVKVIETTAYNVLPDFQRWVFTRGSRAGVAKLGSSCDPTRCVLGGPFCAIDRPTMVVKPKPSPGIVLVAKCG